MRGSKRWFFLHLGAILVLLGISFAPWPGLRHRELTPADKVRSAFLAVRVAFTQYFVEHGSYPPAYGFLLNPDREKPAYHLAPYWALLAGVDASAVLDPCSEGLAHPYDADRNGRIDPLEFLPLGQADATGAWRFPDQRYPWDGLDDELAAELARMAAASQRALIYIPVNQAQFARAKTYWMERGDYLAGHWDYAAMGISPAEFPPSKYDAFALISVGPGNDTFGVVPDTIGGQVDDRDLYHVLALRAFFLATRDLNQNGELDFDYLARTRQGEAALVYPVAGQSVTNQLPSTRAPNGYGPLIFVQQ